NRSTPRKPRNMASSHATTKSFGGCCADAYGPGPPAYGPAAYCGAIGAGPWPGVGDPCACGPYPGALCGDSGFCGCHPPCGAGGQGEPCPGGCAPAPDCWGEPPCGGGMDEDIVAPWRNRACGSRPRG